MSGLIMDAVTAADLPALAGLYEELTREPCDSEAMAREFPALAADQNIILFAARRDGALIGSAMAVRCRKLTRDCRPFLVMENFVVAASHRREGVGKALLLRIERLAVDLGCESVMFISSMRRPEAHAFYAAMEYAPDAVAGFRKRFPPGRPS